VALAAVLGNEGQGSVSPLDYQRYASLLVCDLRILRSHEIYDAQKIL
jgi:hypothetical protein